MSDIMILYGQEGSWCRDFQEKKLWHSLTKSDHYINDFTSDIMINMFEKVLGSTRFWELLLNNCANIYLNSMEK